MIGRKAGAGTSVLGIDLAAGHRKTVACRLELDGGRATPKLHGGCDDDALVGLAEGCEKVAIDAPFGWPDEFVAALVSYRDGGRWPRQDDAAPEALRARLSFRETDRVTAATRRPLSVSTDRLGVTAMRCAVLLDRWSLAEPIDRAGLGRFVEVYPAGALVRWGFDGGSYKRAGAEAIRGALLDRIAAELPALDLDADAREACVSSDDAFDALVAALVAIAAIRGLTDPPPAGSLELARREGWIHLPVSGSLPLLVGAGR